MESDTIVAAVTPPGEGGVGIVRASGPLASSLAVALFPRLAPRWTSHQMRQGALIDPATGRMLDHAMGCLMIAPRSYTGEDVFEIHCHGSPLLVERIVHLCLTRGCRAARPGEFTLRAFLNDRLDLSQAEAVLDVVRARSTLGLDLAVRQLSGGLTTQVEPIREELLGALAHIEALVDFVEDDIPPEIDAPTRGILDRNWAALQALKDGVEGGIVLREGATLAIVGGPNVGKSSIMNVLLGTDRSIVTPIAGTTRDTVEETVQVRGIPFRTIDTAGITETTDPVERIGVERSRATLRTADVVLLVVDRSRSPNDADYLAVQALRESHRERQNEGSPPRIVLACNKSDLPPSQDSSQVFEGLPLLEAVQCNTVTPDGSDSLRTVLEKAALGSNRLDFVSGNVRHRDALARAASALQVALGGLGDGVPLDLLSFDVRAAVAALGEITGHDVDDELLDRIFRDFCIGK